MKLKFTWELWHLINRLNDLVWDHYEDDLMSQKDRIKEYSRHYNHEFIKS